MREIEVKILDIKPDKIRSILKNNNARFVRKVFQKNLFYTNDYASKKKLVIRVRQEDKMTFLTVKANKRIVRNHKVADEYEFSVDYNVITKMLETLGFNTFAATEIKREYWHIHGCSVELCILPGIPPFLEIEGSERQIFVTAKMLGYSKNDYVAGNILKIYNIKNKFIRF